MSSRPYHNTHQRSNQHVTIIANSGPKSHDTHIVAHPLILDLIGTQTSFPKETKIRIEPRYTGIPSINTVSNNLKYLDHYLSKHQRFREYIFWINTKNNRDINANQCVDVNYNITITSTTITFATRMSLESGLVISHVGRLNLDWVMEAK